ILHQDDVLRRVESTIAARLTVEEGLHELGLQTAETHANFSWIDLGDADEAAVIAGLAEREIAVRPGKALGGPGHIRVSYGTAEENERFLRGLSELLD
ncbi:MAG TPA: aminotransferase class I/II-fold pyridoxal phosphate-dependent enzyme, partial [Solirubrobacterales bacterium]